MTMTIDAWQMLEPGKPLVKGSYKKPELASDQVLVKVAGCGVCHTDISFLYLGVPVRSELPLALGHEISGVVVETGANMGRLMDREVIIPAVLPCGECALCKKGRGNACRKQLMPGNDMQGGFASHLVVPGGQLYVLDGLPEGYNLAELSVVADAVTTPYHAIKKAGLVEGEVAVIIGVGGIGTYAALIAKALNATVVALDIDDGKLETIAAQGVDFCLNVRDRTIKEIKKGIGGYCREKGLPGYGWRIFETSGTAPGQELAFGLLTFSGSASIVGFTMDKVTIRLSNLMAFDADLHGNWGCLPAYYSDVVELLKEGRITMKPFIETFPMSRINEILEKAHSGQVSKRPIMIPDF